MILVEVVRNRKTNLLSNKMLSELRSKIFSKLLSLKMKDFEKFPSSDIYTRLTVDAENVNADTVSADRIINRRTENESGSCCCNSNRYYGGRYYRRWLLQLYYRNIKLRLQHEIIIVFHVVLL